MTPGTALALFLLGIAAALRDSKQSGRVPMSLSAFAAVIALAIGLAMIALYALDSQIDVNQLVGGQGGTYAQLSSPPTAVVLILLATAILFYDSRPTLAAWLVLCAGLIAITALLAFLFGATPLYQLPDAPITGVPLPAAALRLLELGSVFIKGVALPTALIGFLIALGLTLARPDAGVMRIFTSPGPSGELFRHTAPVAILAPMVFGLVTARLLDMEDIALALSVLTVLTVVVSVYLVATTVAKFSGIVSTSADAIISIDEDQRIMSFNDSAEKVFGWSRSEVMGGPLDILIPERFRAAHARHVKDFAAGSEAARRIGASSRAIFGLRKNGEEFPADAAISAIVVGGSKFLTAALRDTSEQKRAETEQRLLAEVGAALAETLELDDILTIIARLGVKDLADYCIVDVVEDDGSIRRARAICRNPSRAWICAALMRTPLDGERPRLAWPVLKTGKANLIEKVTPDALNSWARNEEECNALQNAGFRSLIAAPLLARGKLLGALVLISEEPARAFGNDDLRMAEAFAQQAAFFVENARLYRTAKRAVQARDDMLGIVAHDLRNPLAAISALASVLQKSETERETAEEIGNATNRMSRLIQDLLDVSQMEAGRLSLRRARFEATEVISDSLETVAPLASSASIEVCVDVPPGLPRIWADHDRLVRVFENLLGNSIKFTKPGGRITLGAKLRAGEVLFSVADTGCGIATTNLPHVFDRFWQAPGAKRRGVGLGLPIVKGIVEAHGGRVWVQSSPGQGSAFFFTIPTEASRAATGKARVRSHSPP